MELKMELTMRTKMAMEWEMDNVIGNENESENESEHENGNGERDENGNGNGKRQLKWKP